MKDYVDYGLEFKKDLNKLIEQYLNGMPAGQHNGFLNVSLIHSSAVITEARVKYNLTKPKKISV